MSNTTKKCVIYANLTQTEQGVIPVRLKEYAENLGFEVIAEFFDKNNSNIEFEKMLKFIDSIPNISIVFEKISRQYKDLPKYYSICQKDHTLYFRKFNFSMTKEMIPSPLIQAVDNALITAIQEAERELENG